MGLIARESIEEVRRANDIVDVIHGYVPLQKRGSLYWANCPFHDEKTPSFSVSPPRQTYKCFGCGAWGNVIDFVMKFEKLDFPEATEKLADRAAVTLRHEGGGPSRQERSLRSKALEMMEWAQRGFVANLKKYAPAQEYLNARGMGGEVAEKWGLGYAPDDFQRQSTAALKKFDEATIEATGLCRRNDRGWYDFFRGRITFPIRDGRGRVVGFGARLLDPEAKAQKYVNSAEGLLFHKSSLLYGVERLAHSEKLKQTKRVLLMEGYTDVIAAHDKGFDNAVAPLGTALTREQVKLAQRYGQGVTLVLDGDDAGMMAAERGVNVVLEMGVDATVAVLPRGSDPFDLLVNQGAEAFDEVLTSARDAFDFKLDMVRGRNDLGRPVEAEKALGELADMIGRAESPSLRELYARRASAALGVGEQAVVAAVEAAHVRHADLAERYETRESPPAGPELAAGPRPAYEREVLRRLFEHPRAFGSARELVLPEDFRTPALRELYREMLNAFDEHGEVLPGALLSHLGEEARAELDRVLAPLKVVTDQAVDDDEEVRLIDELRRMASTGAGGGSVDLEELRRRKGRRQSRRA